MSKARTMCVATGIGLAAVLGSAAPALATTDKSEQNCINTVERQADRGTTAGGGPKAGIPAPTNCDHYYQGTGLIGSGK